MMTQSTMGTPAKLAVVFSPRTTQNTYTYTAAGASRPLSVPVSSATIWREGTYVGGH